MPCGIIAGMSGGHWRDARVVEQVMPCYIALPEETPAAPGVLVCMHGPGVDGFLTAMCDRLAASGFGAIAPNLYYRQREPAANPREAASRLRDTEVLVDMAAAVALLRANPAIDAGRFGVVGFCMGGRLAFLHAAHEPELAAAVVFYGGDIAVAWGDGASPLEQAAAIRAPVLGMFGADDTNPSPTDVERIDEALDRAGVPHEFHTYDGAGHAFLHFKRPTAYRKDAADDAWARCIAWLRHHLG
jgi:carboxymethylenebutenolidase